jgi:hypothetical protein
MSSTEADVLIVAILVLVAVYAFIRYRGSAKVKIHGPGKIGMDLDASNDRAPAVVVEDAKSHEGGIRVEDGTGAGAHVRRVEAEQDIHVTARSEKPDPKAEPR